ncbi:putative adenylate-forming enzyme [Ureibacillus xyleni]|uniref:Putative adenylate-forming enzyme n=1 Tax=Ureibacillus xyleni TaxID=614648 RepID=A0A285RYX0_9BACL|nr:F390 synthetase-related protein [Ureibacillus xyleni]SOB99277.1 putative adenylate-forming enzyme [Ureibacillus xyleni]
MLKLVTILQNYLRVKRIQTYSPDAFRQWQTKQLKKHLKWIKLHSPYFNNGPLNLSDFPYMDKQMMMDNFDLLNTKGINKDEAFEIALSAEENRDFSPTIGNITVGLSSGTSGNRGIFLVSEEEQAAWAGTILAKLLPNGFKNREKIAFFLRANSNLYESVKSRKIEFTFFDLLDHFETHLKRLEDYQPTILAAPPSMVRRIAETVKEKKLTIQPIKIITMAEVLDPLDEQFIEGVFQQKVHQVYQCTEGFLGCTCKHGTIHLNEDIIYIEKEFLNLEKTKFYPIITDFRRRTQPIIRYRLNDILTIKTDPCPCGSPMLAIEQIEGRMDDLFILKNYQNKMEYVFPDFIRRACITASDNLKEYKVIQHNMNEIEVQCLVFNEDKRQETEQSIQANLTGYLKENYIVPGITFGHYQEIDILTKLKRIENKMQKDIYNVE